MTCVRYAPPHSLWSFLHLSGIKSAQRCEMTQHFSWFSDAYITLDFLRSNKKPWIEMIYKLRHNIYFSAGLQAQISADIIRARLSLSTRRSFKVFQCPVGPWMTMMSCECGGSALHNTARRLICVTSIWGKRLLQNDQRQDETGKWMPKICPTGQMLSRRIYLCMVRGPLEVLAIFRSKLVLCWNSQCFNACKCNA